jgi:hypothetical protein
LNTFFTVVGGLAQIPKREHHHGLPIVGVRVLPSKRVRQPGGRVDLTELPQEEETIPFKWLHLDPITASDAHVELDARGGKSLGAPPLGEQLR